ncbi:MAG: hypothetical protein RL757_1249 [Bacteroidota bacterium]|jgi:hypothetical protein
MLLLPPFGGAGGLNTGGGAFFHYFFNYFFNLNLHIQKLDPKRNTKRRSDNLRD